MVTKTASGYRAIVNPRPFPMRHHLYDAWPTHAVEAGAIYTDFTASGLTAWASHFMLRSGDEFWYPFGISHAPDTPSVYQDYLAFQAPNVGGFYTGESYNYVLRSAAQGKLDATDWYNYLLAH